MLRLYLVNLFDSVSCSYTTVVVPSDSIGSALVEVAGNGEVIGQPLDVSGEFADFVLKHLSEFTSDIVYFPNYPVSSDFKVVFARLLDSLFQDWVSSIHDSVD